ncbi:MAG: hypothetical protein Q8L14_11010 [Myxococcales bacterium]|nr:hypothetical protein [Myxococcales bacterium]
MAGLGGVGGGGGSDRTSEAQRAAAERAAEARAAERAAVAAEARARTETRSTFEAPPARDMVALGAVASPAATEAATKVIEASTTYLSAREEVARLNGSLERALRTEPSLQNPEAAERFRTEFLTEHADVYAAERSSAQALASALREAEPHIRADGMSVGNAGNRLGVLAGLEILASSSEYAQAAELAGRYGRGRDAAMPREELAGIAERASLTGLREDLAAGVNAEQAVRNAGGLLGAWGFARSTPALSAIGNAIGAGADLSAFMRTGDPASLGAAGFGALGTAAAVTALVASGPIAVGAGVVSGLALGGKFITRQIAGDNEYHAAIDGPMAETHGLSADQTQALMGREGRMLAAAGLSSADLAELARTDSLDEALRVLASGTPLDTGVYGDAIDPVERDARMRALEQEQPGLPYISYEMNAVDAMRAERRAQGTPAELLRADLRAQGLLP